MTQRHLLEILLQHFDTTEVYLRHLCNQAQAEYAAITRCLRSRDNISTDGTNTLFDVPALLLSTNGILDPNGKQCHPSSPYRFHLLPGGEVCWWMDPYSPGKVQLGYHDGSGSFKPLSSGNTYEIYFERYPTVLSDGNMDTELDFPLELQGAIEARVMGRAVANDPEGRRFWYALYEDYVKRGIQLANTYRSTAPFQVVQPVI